jgi:3-oxoacyl-[acyl-carrier protein] reductase
MVEGLGRKGVALRADVGSKTQVEALFAQIDREFGKLDILINNAALGGPKSLEELDLEFWERVLRTNLTGPFLCTQAAARRMIPQKYGRIVNISSLAGVRGADMNAAYTASKAGLLGFTKSAARYLGKYNITVNAVSPGPVETEFSKQLPEHMRAGAARQAALGRSGTPEDIADAVLFFASDDSRHVTGQMILADGGIEMP